VERPTHGRWNVTEKGKGASRQDETSRGVLNVNMIPPLSSSPILIFCTDVHDFLGVLLFENDVEPWLSMK